METAQINSTYDAPVTKTHDESEAPNLTVYVGGVSYDAREDELRDLFKDCGTIVSAKLPIGHDGRPRGIGYVEFSDQESVDKALDMDGQDFLGRNIKVDMARAKRAAPAFEDNSDKPRPDGCMTIFIGNLSYRAREDDLYDAFDRCGKVASVRLIEDRDTGRPKGFGYVEFETEEGVTAAIKMTGTEIAGRPVRIDYANGGSSRGGERRGGDRDNRRRDDRDDRRRDDRRGGDRDYRRRDDRDDRDYRRRDDRRRDDRDSRRDYSDAY